jgi:glycosyltransferase involved in cell wall biosynthesis
LEQLRKQIDIAVACLYPIRPDRIGGMDRFFWAFDKAIREVGKSMVWFFPKSDAFQHYQNHGLQIEFISDAIFESGLIDSLQNNYKASMVICHFVSYNTRYVSRLKSCVGKLYFVDHMSRPRMPKSLKYRIWYYFKGLINRKHIDGIIAVSDYVKNRISSELGSRWMAKTHTIHNGVDFELYQSTKSNPDSITDLFAIGYVTIDKGFQDLIYAVSNLKQEFPAIRCVVAGDGPFKLELENMVLKHGLSSHIRFLGNINNQYDWMRNSKVVVIPSLWYEACPFTVIESMACGSSMVVSDAGGIPELVGDTALVYPKGDTTALSYQLKKLLADPMLQSSLGSKAAERANQHFGLHRMVEDHFDYTLLHLI